jgi:hypothetical protein
VDAVRTAADVRRYRRKLVVMSIVIFLAGLALNATRVLGHLFAPDFFPKLRPSDYAEDTILRISGICMFWGFVGFIRSLFISAPEEEVREPQMPTPTPDERSTGQVTLATARWVETSSREAELRRRVAGRSGTSLMLRVFVVLPLSLLAAFCALLTLGFLFIYFTKTPGPFAGEAALAAAAVCGFVGFGCVYGVWALSQKSR